MSQNKTGASTASHKRRTDIQLLNTTISVYSGKRVADALAEISVNMNVYQGVKLSQILEAVYEQGKKDGARSVFEALDGVRATIPHRNPGQPKKRKKQAG
jgi:hypothetical protein